MLDAFYQDFFLKGFLFVSGYCYKNRNDFRVMIKKKNLQLLIPWLLWGLLSVCFHQVFSGWRKSTHIMGFGDEVLWFLLQVRGINDGPWFIAMLYSAFIPFYFLIKAYESSQHQSRFKWTLFALYIVGIVYGIYMPPFAYGTNALPWHIEYLPNALFFMFLGYEYRNIYEKKSEKYESLLFGVVTVVYLTLSCVSYFFSMGKILSVLMTTAKRIVGVSFIVLLSKKLKPNNYTRFVGQNTLTYFPMHIYIFVLGEAILHKVLPDLYTGILNNELLSACFSLAFAVLISLILILPAKFVNKYLPFIAGKPLPPKEH